jgi:hypothetical protein
MSYSDFSLRTAREQFGLILREDIDLFKATPEVETSPQLRDFLKEWSPAALAMNTEKARSEMIIAPILMELVRLSGHRLNLFSGLSLDVDKERGLSGVCDYLLALSPERYFLSHPLSGPPHNVCNDHATSDLVRRCTPGNPPEVFVGRLNNTDSPLSIAD